MKLLAGLVLSLTAAVVGVWGVSRRDRPLHGMRDDGTLGLPRLQRWDVSYRPPRLQRLRSAIPRFELSRAVILVALLLIVGTSGAILYTHTRAQQSDKTAAFTQAFEAIQARHVEAKSQSDVATAYAMLIEARARLDELAKTNPGADAQARMAGERSAILSDIATLANAQQFQSEQAIGAAPPAPAGVTPRLVAGGGRVYLLSDAFYQLDSGDDALVRLLHEGDTVDTATVGVLRGAAWRDDRPVVMDAAHAYALDPATGLWHAEDLGTFDQTGFTDVQALEIYGRNLYVLAPQSGQILKFAADRYSDVPEDWTGGVNEPDLEHATDLAIDGHVYALLADGRVLDFFLSRLEATLAPTLVPPLDQPVALEAAANSQFLYVLNGSDGRIVRLARDGSSVEQFMPPDDAPAISHAQDFVLDESSGVAFLLADNTLYSARIPPPQ